MQANKNTRPYSVLHEFKKNAIRRIRDKRISISELARITGIKQSTLHRGLYEERELTFSNALAISRALDIGLGSAAAGGMAPVIRSFDQLAALSDGRQPIWDEFIALEPSLDDSALAIDQALFRQRVFPRRSVVVVQTAPPWHGRIVFVDRGALSLEDNGHAALGCVAAIIFRNNT
ncbi:hypothetical protein BI343_16825 [Chromobacterium amazonense]|uniref:helix-turn-helix domain-containing protein n=1 Tax=Chromobacterium amazonense TaxID=1382803 RepID=UPI0008DA64DC|nr:helix-turn-helix transcriptional regulator [Chromobacterium amazonense]OHX15640.1 hypothetical protein BI343_16825 [Chromobacterium amazonense]